MKIILFALNAAYIHTNLAIRALRKPLDAAGFEVRVIEGALKDRRDRMLASLYEERADVYGFSCYIWNLREMLSLACDLKSLLPACKIIFGGPEVSFEDEPFLDAHPFIDHLIRGEGEDALTSLCTDLAEGKAALRILDGRPYSSFDHAGILYDDSRRGQMVYYESSRGCPYRCAYCLSSLSGSVRAKSAEVTLAELEEFEKSCPDARIIKFVDRTFNFDRERARIIWRGLREERFTKTYHFEICASLLEEEDFAILASLPKDRIQLEAGVQSTNPNTLRAISRTDDSEAVIASLKRLMSLGNMHIHADLIAGLPEEDLASMRRSFDMVYGSCHMLQLGFLKLLKGSALRENAEKWGYRYMSEPPYTVLANDFISFEELMILHHIDEVVDRFSNSGKFAKSLNYLVQKSSSPFDLFRELGDFCADIQKLGQRDAHERLAAFAQSRGLLDEAYLMCARFDWLSGESAPLPSILRGNFAVTERVPPSGEIYTFDFGRGGERYYFDRSSHEVKKLK
ncbi:MAG: DUF4080 domain-containing protein [Clostridia bacterium]|nr:DUF4080 domain-containing protein [Clostridia bacterium]